MTAPDVFARYNVRSQGSDVPRYDSVGAYLHAHLRRATLYRMVATGAPLPSTACRNYNESALHLALDSRTLASITAARAFADNPEVADALRAALDDRTVTELELRPGARVLGAGRTLRMTVTERAFEPFFTTKRFGSGMGFGLSMIYGMARDHGGAVTIEREPGRGTCVSVLLPRVTPTHD